MKAKDRYRKAMAKIAKVLDKAFPNPLIVDKDTVLDQDADVRGSFVLSTPEVGKAIEASQATGELLDAHEKYDDKVEPFLSPEHGNYGLPEEQRKEAVEKYRAYKAEGRILRGTKAEWVKTYIGISIRQFQEWEKEFPE